MSRPSRLFSTALLVASIALFSLVSVGSAAAAQRGPVAQDAAATYRAYATSKQRAARVCAALRQTRRERTAAGARGTGKVAHLARSCRAARASKRRARQRLKRLGRRVSRRRKPAPTPEPAPTPQPAPTPEPGPTDPDPVPTEPTPTPPPSGSSTMRWGLVANTYGRGSGAAAEQERTKATGIGWLREEFDTAPNSATDAVVLSAAQRGLRILPILQTDDELPTDINSYAEIVASHARRYGPAGTFWAAHPELDAALASSHFEIYNEPYGDWYGVVDPARYTQVLRAAVTSGRAANPAAKFLMAIDHVPGGVRNTWIDDLYRAEPALNNYFDAVAIHPYSSARAPDEPDDLWGFQRIGEAREAMARHGAGSKPFWITELGWSTCPSDPKWCVSEQKQAQYMERAAEMVRTQYPYVEAMFFYHFRLDEQNPAESEHFYGIVHDDLSPKPAYHALRRITGVAN